MSLIQIKPIDNTFFREGNLFEREVSNIVNSRNVAFPTTFFGAIFSAILSKNDKFRESFLRIRNNKDHLRILSIDNVYILNEKSDLSYLKAPKDIFVSKKVIKYGDFKENIGPSSIPYPFYLENPSGDSLKRADNYYIEINALNKYKNKVIDTRDIKSEDEIFVKNSRTGIGIESFNKNVIESHLFTIEQTEFNNFSENDWSYVVQYHINEEYIKSKYDEDNILELDAGFLKLGGENKVCTYKTLRNNDIENFSKSNDELIKAGEVVKVILTSDSYFSGNIESYFEDSIKVLAVVNDKPLYMGGYDIAENKAKVMKKGFSAGSIILLKNISNESVDLRKLIKNNSQVSYNQGFNKFLLFREE